MANMFVSDWPEKVVTSVEGTARRSRLTRVFLKSAAVIYQKDWNLFWTAQGHFQVGTSTPPMVRERTTNLFGTNDK